MGSGGGSKGSSESSTQVDIPDFLQPFLNQAAGVSGSALRNLQRQSGGDLAADLTPDQLQALGIARDRALGEGGFFQTAQDQFSNTANGVDIRSFLDPSALATLTGGGLESFLPESVLSNLNSLQTSQLPDFLQSSTIPQSVTDTLSANQGIPSQATDALANAAGGFGIPDASRNALESTANGDFLFGGEGFDQAVDAALRRAQPQILSTFGRAGAGGSTSGLAQSAIGQSAVDAFASQFGQERGRQLSAADSLAGLDLAGRQTSIGAADSLGRLGLADNQQSINSAGLLGNLNLSDSDLRGRLGLSNDNLRLGASGLLGGFGSDEQNRQLSSANTLAGLSDAERNRQLGAAGALPDIGLLDSNALFDIGSIFQGQNQDEINAPLQAQQQLLLAALSGLPISQLLGQSGDSSSSGFSLGFGG